MSRGAQGVLAEEAADADQPLLLRHPRAVLAVAAAILVVLAVIGTGVEDRLDPTTLDVPGTESSRGNEMLREHFGDSAPFAILLRGPAAAIDRQGPELIRALRAGPAGDHALALGPRLGRAPAAEPGPGADPRRLPRRHATAVNETVPHLNDVLAEKIHAAGARRRRPATPASRGRSRTSRIDATERGELIALPFLLIILLLVFRSPIAAAIPLAFGAVTVRRLARDPLLLHRLVRRSTPSR